MRDLSQVHPKWRDTCLNCLLPTCAEDLPGTDPRKKKYPVYRQQQQYLLIRSKRGKEGNGNAPHHLRSQPLG